MDDRSPPPTCSLVSLKRGLAGFHRAEQAVRHSGVGTAVHRGGRAGLRGGADRRASAAAGSWSRPGDAVRAARARCVELAADPIARPSDGRSRRGRRALRVRSSAGRWRPTTRCSATRWHARDEARVRRCCCPARALSISAPLWLADRRGDQARGRRPGASSRRIAWGWAAASFRALKFRSMVPDARRRPVRRARRRARSARHARRTRAARDGDGRTAAALEHLPRRHELRRPARRSGRARSKSRGDGRLVALDDIPGYDERHSRPARAHGPRAGLCAARHRRARDKFRLDRHLRQQRELLARPPPDRRCRSGSPSAAGGKSGRESSDRQPSPRLRRQARIMNPPQRRPYDFAGS